MTRASKPQRAAAATPVGPAASTAAATPANPLTPANAFIGQSHSPTEEELSGALGAKTKKLWDRLLSRLEEEHNLSVREWNSYSPKAGWSLRLKRGKRNIVYLAPCSGCFRIAFILGDKAVRAARASGLPAEAIRALDEATRYPEGNGVRLVVREARDLDAVVQLAQIKLEN